MQTPPPLHSLSNHRVLTAEGVTSYAGHGSIGPRVYRADESSAREYRICTSPREPEQDWSLPELGLAWDRMTTHLKEPICNALSPMMFGVFVMFMIVLIPIWNCIIMLQDDVFLFFVGEDLPWGMIVVLVCTVVLFMLTTVIFYLMGRGTARLTEKQTLSVFTTFTTMLAVILLTYSQSMRMRETELSHDLLSCRLHNPHVMQLAIRYQDLQEIRNEAGCAEESSVDVCEGFTDSRESSVLQSMEDSLVCSGFCINTPRGMNARERALISQAAAGGSAVGADVEIAAEPVEELEAVAEAATGASGLLQRQQRIRLRQPAEETDGADAAGQEVVEEAVDEPNMESGGVGVSLPYPPNLFSPRHNQASCNGMAARSLSSFLGDMAEELSMQGMFLVLVAACTCLLVLIDGCTGRQRGVIYKETFAGSMEADTDYGSLTASRLPVQFSGARNVCQ